MTKRGIKRSRHELKRLVEDAVATACRLPRPGLWFVVDGLEAQGNPPERLRIWYTLHFVDEGSPFCCGEPGCHLGLGRGEWLREVGDHVRRAMNLRHRIEIEVVDHAAVYHTGVEFSFSP